MQYYSFMMFGILPSAIDQCSQNFFARELLLKGSEKYVAKKTFKEALHQDLRDLRIGSATNVRVKIKSQI